MFTQITDKKEIKRIKESFLNGDYVNTTSYENGTGHVVAPKFKKLLISSYKDDNTFKKFHDIKYPNIEDVISSLSLVKQSFTNTTYRRYKLWCVTYNDKHIIISHNKDRGIDVYFIEEMFSELELYDMLYNYYKTIYESKGNTDFTNYYPTIGEL